MITADPISSLVDKQGSAGNNGKSYSVNLPRIKLFVTSKLIAWVLLTIHLAGKGGKNIVLILTSNCPVLIYVNSFFLLLLSGAA